MAHLHLVRSRPVAASPDHDTVSCLQELLAKAERGEIIGLTYAAVRSSRRFCYGACGEAHRNPVVAAGMTTAMLYGIASQMHGQGGGVQGD